jgi:hypothetical protein
VHIAAHSAAGDTGRIEQRAENDALLLGLELRCSRVTGVGDAQCGCRRRS